MPGRSARRVIILATRALRGAKKHCAKKTKNSALRSNEGTLSAVNKLLKRTYLCGNMKASSKSARAFSSDATTRKISLTESIPQNSPRSSSTMR